MGTNRWMLGLCGRVLGLGIIGGSWAWVSGSRGGLDAWILGRGVILMLLIGGSWAWVGASRGWVPVGGSWAWVNGSWGLKSSIFIIIIIIIIILHPGTRKQLEHTETYWVCPSCEGHRLDPSEYAYYGVL